MSDWPEHLQCPQHGRHWFTLRGYVGDYVEACVRCGVTRTQIREWQAEQRRLKRASDSVGVEVDQ